MSSFELSSCDKHLHYNWLKIVKFKAKVLKFPVVKNKFLQTVKGYPLPFQQIVILSLIYLISFPKMKALIVFPDTLLGFRLQIPHQAFKVCSHFYLLPGNRYTHINHRLNW